MGDNGTAGPPAKKRGASRQISKDDSSDSEGNGPTALESGSFQKASEEVLATRRIVKVRRTPNTGGPPAPTAPNPFASIRLVAPSTVTVADGAGSILGKDSSVTSQEASSKSEDTAKPTEPVEGAAKAAEEVKADAPKPEGEEAKADESAAKAEVGDVAKLETGVSSAEASKNDGASVSKDETKTSESTKVEDKTEGGTAKVEEEGQVKKLDADEGEKKEEDKDAGHNGASQKADATAAKTGTAKPPVFTFGTSATSSETPSGFASFSSTWGSFSAGSGFGFKAAGEGEGGLNPQTTAPGSSNGSTFQLFSNTQTSTVAPSQPATSVQFQEVVVETGEEKEKTVFGADATLFEFAESSWKERGKGELKVNVPEDKSAKPRLVMRAKGNYKLLMNALLFPDMKMTSMDSRGVTFACINSAVEGKTGLTTYAVKFRDSLAATNFRDTVDAHKSASREGLKTPENSPRAES